jgi:hypothetical protein
MEEDEADDWTVCRGMMTLKEAQEEDAMELRHDMAEEALKGKPVPRKQRGDYYRIGKAAPLQYIWHRTKVLPKKEKTVDFAALYKKGLAMHAAKQ